MGIGDIIFISNDIVEFTASKYDSHPQAEARYHDFHYFQFLVSKNDLKEYHGDYLQGANVVRMNDVYYTYGEFGDVVFPPRCSTPYGCNDSFEFQLGVKRLLLSRPGIAIIDQNNDYAKPGEGLTRKIVHTEESILIGETRYTMVIIDRGDGKFSSSVCKSNIDSISTKDIIIENPVGIDSVQNHLFIGEMRGEKVFVHEFDGELK